MVLLLSVGLDRGSSVVQDLKAETGQVMTRQMRSKTMRNEGESHERLPHMTREVKIGCWRLGYLACRYHRQEKSEKVAIL